MNDTGRRSAEEIDDRDLVLHRIPEPAVVRRVRVRAHECVINDIITGVDLAMQPRAGRRTKPERPFAGTRFGWTAARPSDGA
jgi:hypothetical protein